MLNKLLYFSDLSHEDTPYKEIKNHWDII
jgi:hypothetical protein